MTSGDGPGEGPSWVVLSPLHGFACLVSSSMIRQLDEDELALIGRLLGICGRTDLLTSLRERLVKEMEDGRMGSLAFQPEHGRNFGAEIAAVEFSDSDGLLVLATLNIDKAGDLYELDIRKTNFGPLKTLEGGNVNVSVGSKSVIGVEFIIIPKGRPAVCLSLKAA